MKIEFITLILFTILSGCWDGQQNSDNRNIEHITTNNSTIRDFDRIKYSIVQDATLLKLDGKLEESIEEFNRAERKYGEMIQIYLNRGDAYDQLGLISKAETEFTNCLKLDSTYIPALVNRGLIYTHSNQLEKGLADFNRAIAIDSNEPISYLNRAVAYGKLKKLDLACSDLFQAKSLGISEKYGSEMVNELITELNCK